MRKSDVIASDYSAKSLEWSGRQRADRIEEKRKYVNQSGTREVVCHEKLKSKLNFIQECDIILNDYVLEMTRMNEIRSIQKMDHYRSPVYVRLVYHFL